MEELGESKRFQELSPQMRSWVFAMSTVTELTASVEQRSKRKWTNRAFERASQ
jgi:hypothetical protein